MRSARGRDRPCAGRIDLAGSTGVVPHRLLSCGDVLPAPAGAHRVQPFARSRAGQCAAGRTGCAQGARHAVHPELPVLGLESHHRDGDAPHGRAWPAQPAEPDQPLHPRVRQAWQGTHHDLSPALAPGRHSRYRRGDGPARGARSRAEPASAVRGRTIAPARKTPGLSRGHRWRDPRGNRQARQRHGYPQGVAYLVQGADGPESARLRRQRAGARAHDPGGADRHPGLQPGG